MWTSENGRPFPLQNVKVSKYSFQLQLSVVPKNADKNASKKVYYLGWNFLLSSPSNIDDTDNIM